MDILWRTFQIRALSDSRANGIRDQTEIEQQISMYKQYS